MCKTEEFKLAINDAKSKSIVEVARQLGLTIVGSGRTVTTKEYSSLTLYSKSGVDDFKRYSANGGNSGGSCIDLVMHVLGIEFKEAVEYLTGSSIISKNIDFSKPIAPPEKPKPINVDYSKFEDRFWADNHYGQSVRSYMNSKRGIGYETLSECDIGMGTAWVSEEFPAEVVVTFPYYDELGQLMGIRYRVINEKVSKPDRMRSMAGSSFKHSVFGADMPIIEDVDSQALKDMNRLDALLDEPPEPAKTFYSRRDTLYVFEGETNTLAARSVGFNAVSVGGQLMDASDALIEHCKKFKRVVVWFDEITHSKRVSGQIEEAASVETISLTSLVLSGGKELDANDFYLMGRHEFENYLDGFSYSE